MASYQTDHHATSPDLPAKAGKGDRAREYQRMTRAERRVDDYRRRLWYVRESPYIPHTPQMKQAAFLCLDDREALYGGAAGGGKSDALLMAALMYAHVPGYTALILRQSYKDLALPDAIMDRAIKWMEPTNAHWTGGQKTFTFPSGARLVFGYLKGYRDVFQYQGAAFQFVGFDETTQFGEKEYRYLFSRVRRPKVPCARCRRPLDYDRAEGEWNHANDEDPMTCDDPAPAEEALEEYKPSKLDGRRVFDVPLRMRGATNPGGTGHAWVKRRFIEENRTFIPATLADNAYLDRKEYTRGLMELDPITRQRLLAGDWDATAGGQFFKRLWFAGRYLRTEPRGVTSIRYWDLASTRPNDRNADPDWTASLKMSLRDGVYFITDVRRVRRTPGGTEDFIETTAHEDGPQVVQYFEQEPGSGGKFEIHHIRKRLAGFEVRKHRPSGSKEKRAGPVASAAEAGNVYLCDTGAWFTPLTTFFDELEAFPDGTHDDMVDALSGAHYALSFDEAGEDYRAATT